jgi:phosphate transport system substrate-binding protein
MRSWRIFLPFILIVLAGLQFGAGTAQAQDKIMLVGSGSNVPLRLYQAWIDEFNKKDPGVQVQYLALGTSQSIKQVSGGSGDFGGGEIPLSNEQMRGGKVKLAQIPTVLVGIVPVYNLPAKPDLDFSGELLAQIYLGVVKNWKDPKIAELNPDVKLPDLPIHVVHRSAGKGSNYIFTDFLSKTSSDFRNRVGKSASPKWPLGADANRGEDMVEKVASIRGAIGYVEVNFVRNAAIGYGRVQNAAGHFVRATPESIDAACRAGTKSSPGNLQVSITNASGKESYPISSFTWIYVPVSGISPVRRHALKAFLEWSLRDGQRIAKDMGYATLPDKVHADARSAVKSMP